MRTKSISHLFGILLFAAVTAQAANMTLEELAQQRRYDSAPPELWERFDMLARSDGNLVDTQHQNPFFLQGDFDGDGIVDFAVRLHKGDAGKLALLRGNGELTWIEDFGLATARYGAWHVEFASSAIQRQTLENSKADAIAITTGEMSGGYHYWDGKSFMVKAVEGC
jgi:hypothetical protein